MPTRKQKDQPGAWWHVMNRGIARRTLFERRADMAKFLEPMQKVFERYGLDLHSMSVLTTHFHLLLHSREGRLSQALHDLQLAYVRGFNVGRRRDGPLLRGPFKASLIDSYAYRRNVVGYIDRNPVQAGLVAFPEQYEFGSAWHYARSNGPDWLTREWVEGEVCAALGLNEYDPRRYAMVFGAGFVAARDRLVEARLLRPAWGVVGSDPTDSLLRGAAPAVLDWMQRKALLADGTRPGLPILPTEAVVAAGLLPEQPLEPVSRRRWLACPEGRMFCLLLRDLSGLTLTEIGVVIGSCGETVRRAIVAARRDLRTDDAFANRVSALGHRLIVATFGPSYGANVSIEPGSVRTNQRDIQVAWASAPVSL